VVPAGVRVGDGVGVGVGAAVGAAVVRVGVGVGVGVGAAGGVLGAGAEVGAEAVGVPVGAGADADGAVPLLVAVGTGADDCPADGGAVAVCRVGAAVPVAGTWVRSETEGVAAGDVYCHSGADDRALDDAARVPVGRICESVASVPADGVADGSNARGSPDGAASLPAATPTAVMQETTSSTATTADQGGAFRANATAPHRPLYREQHTTLDETASHVHSQVTRYVTHCSPTGHRPGVGAYVTVHFWSAAAVQFWIWGAVPGLDRQRPE
jgi:hypothetical protein